MGYLLLWIEMVAAFGLWIGLVCAITARRRVTRLHIVVQIILMLSIILLPVLLVWLLVTELPLYRGWFNYVAAWGIVSMLVGSAIIYFGMRRNEDKRVAEGWPRLRLGIALLLVLGLHLFTINGMDVAIKERLARLRTDVTSMVASITPQQVPNSENAALYYKRLPEMLPDSEEECSKEYGTWCDWLEGRGGEYHPVDPNLRKYLSSRQEALALLHCATALPRCNFQRDYSGSMIDLLLPEIHFIRRGSRCLALNAMVQSADGNTGGAIRDIASMVQMSNHMKTDPPLISVLVAISLDRHASRAIEHVLATSKPITKPFGPTNPSGHPDPWSQVEGPLADPFRCSDAISRSLQMEEAFGLSIFCDLAGGLNGSSDLLFVLSESQTDMLNCRPAAALWRVFFITEDVQAYRRKMDKVQALSLMPYHEGAQDRQELSDDDFKDAGVMTAMLVPALVNCLEAGARGDAIRGLAQLGIAMEKYKSVEGEYPANLDLLLPEYLQIIPRDPFDGKRLKMVEADGDVVLYSIGPDGVDDGGKEYNWDDKKGDITFCLGDAYATRRLKAVEEPEEIAEENVEEGESR